PEVERGAEIARQRRQVAADEGEVRGAKLLLEAAQQRIARVAHGEDGACMGEESANERQPHHVEGILVYQTLSRLELDLAPHVMPVAVANLQQLSRTQFSELRGVADATGAHVFERLLQERCLVHRSEQGMGVEDLLEQRRARARKRDDEDRTVLDAGRARILPARDIPGIAAVPGQLDGGGALGRLLAQCGNEEGDLRAVRFLERHVSLLVSPQSIERLGEREQEMMPPE